MAGGEVAVRGIMGEEGYWHNGKATGTERQYAAKDVEIATGRREG